MITKFYQEHLPLNTLFTFLLLLILFTEETFAQTRIMPLGNSITQGNGSQSSYRRPLWHLLQNHGYSVNFVGSMNSNLGSPTPNPDFDLDHEGHYGWRADELQVNVKDWAIAAKPDIVLLHAGSNDIFQDQSISSTVDDLSLIIDDIRAANPNVTFLFAQLINADWNAEIAALNQEIPNLAALKHTPESPIIVVDQATGFYHSEDTYDWVHPNDNGEQKMANKWFEALKTILTAIPTIVSQPTLSPAAGTFSVGQTVTISSATTSSHIRYTTDGSNPTPTHGILIDNSSGTVTINNSLHLKAIAYESDAAKSAVTSGTYTISSDLPPNGIVRELWTNISGTSVSDIPVSTDPTSTSTISSLEGPANSGDQYGARIRAFITPAASGSYIFSIAGNDNSELWLSTDDRPSNASLIASITGSTNLRQWDKYTSQQSNDQNLTAGKKYYVEVLHKEGDGGDNLAVGWTGPGISAFTIISGTVLSPYTESPPSSEFSGTYKLTARHSNKALDGSAGSTADGANVQQWLDNGTAAQQWIITPATDGYYKIASKISNKALEVSDNSTADGGDIQQWSYSGAHNQQWEIESTTDGYHRLINRHSGKVLEVAEESSSDGANVHQWSYVEGGNQQWKLEKLSSATSPLVLAVDEVNYDVSIYPNPVTQGVLRVRFGSGPWGKLAIVFTDVLGTRVLKYGYTENKKGNTIDIPTAGMASGLYILTLQNEKLKIIKKIYIR